MVNNNNQPIVEERTIEQINEQQITELREQIRILQNELKEKEEENEELDKLTWEGIRKLESEREENKKFRLLSLFRKNNIKKLLRKWSADERKVYELEKESKEKDREIANLKQELAREKQEKGQVQQELTNLKGKYELEVKSKEELLSLLNTYRLNGVIITPSYYSPWWDENINGRDRIQKLIDDRSNYQTYSHFVILPFPSPVKGQKFNEKMGGVLDLSKLKNNIVLAKQNNEGLNYKELSFPFTIKLSEKKKERIVNKNFPSTVVLPWISSDNNFYYDKDFPVELLKN